ncbi:hypothetical protein ACJX0J_030976, partial [Zea mays]
LIKCQGYLYELLKGGRSTGAQGPTLQNHYIEYVVKLKVYFENIVYYLLFLLSGDISKFCGTIWSKLQKVSRASIATIGVQVLSSVFDQDLYKKNKVGIAP